MSRYTVKVAKSDLWAAIRKKCRDCCGNSTKEVRLCHLEDCPLHPFRFGKAIENGDDN